MYLFTKLFLKTSLIFSCLFLFSLLFVHKARAQSDDLNSLMELSLEDLTNIEVTSVSRKPENRFKAAAAVTVLTSEDIRRLGVTTIAEALRSVPGLNIARIDSNKWAISVRGFNRQFSNKLQVLIDGRSVYTPLFSGVYWDVQDMVLNDIDRIEIIRGPGATMWGANAVNGIINIITKSAEFTQGNYLAALYGNHERGVFEARHGGRAGKDKYYRIYGKHVNRDEARTLTRTGNDDEWYQTRGGFRLDWHKSMKDKLRLQGDLYIGHEEQTHIMPGLIAAGVNSPADGDEIYHGSNLLGSWRHNHEDGSQSDLQVYIDYIYRDTSNILSQRRLTFDIDYQNRLSLDERNNLIWGLGYRFFRDWINEETLGNGQQYLNYEPERSYNSLYSAFIQNEYAIIPDELLLTIGSKFSHNYFTDFEIQPNVRLAWHQSEKQTFWGAVSRAIRIPTRSERGLTSIALSTPGGFVRQSARGERDYDSEKLIAYEFGHRIRPTWWFSMDTALFYHDYDELRTFETGVSGFNSPNTLFEIVASNSGFAESYGAEISANFSITPRWKLFVNYSFLELQMHTLKGSDDFLIAAKEGQSPEHQFNISSRYNFNNIEIDNTFYYVDELPAHNVGDYLRFDTRVSWKPLSGVEISVVGQNLLDDYHQEIRPSLYSRPAEIGRSLYVRLTLGF